jgi:hypothetical protein
MAILLPIHSQVMVKSLPSDGQVMAKLWPVMSGHVKVIAATLSPGHLKVMASHGPFVMLTNLLCQSY